VTGAGAAETFANEAGGHRWQHVPAHDKRGRVQTSTITVAVLPEPTEVELVIYPQDLEWSFSRGSGPGGQNRNVTNSAVDLKYRPTGLVVHAESERSQQDNKRVALATLRARLWSSVRERQTHDRNADRRQQVGGGARGDKTFTIAVQRGEVIYHPTGKKIRLREYLAGDYEV